MNALLTTALTDALGKSANQFNKFKENSHLIIKKILENKQEIKRVNAPKLEIMIYFKDAIKEMIDACFPVQMQMEVLSQSMPVFSITPDTYRTNLEKIVGADALREYKINMYFLRALPKIRALQKEFKNDLKKQFEALDKKELVSPQGRVYVVITIDDYMSFLKKFKDEVAGGFSHVIDGYCAPDFDSSPTNVKEKKRKKTFQSEVQETSFEVSVQSKITEDMAVCVVQKEEKVETANHLPVVKKDDYRAVKNEKDEIGNLIHPHTVREGVTVDNINSRFEIFEDKYEVPNDVSLGFELTSNRDEFAEFFSYFNDIALFQASDYIPDENELLICGRKHTIKNENRMAYDMYRFFDGVLYKTEFFNPHSIILYGRQFRTWSGLSSTKEFQNFENEWIDYTLAFRKKKEELEYKKMKLEEE
ncbi:MAG: hypothetical protein RBT59_07890 [Arcobacteraceae bacterium]|jgi:hypothetical protein|nr:hypothetical protein [Arcobacteraceae bacterium]